MDTQELSVLAAWAAAGVALIGVGFQFFVGSKQAQAAIDSAKAAQTSANAALMNAQNAGRHKVAEFRQAWINEIIDALSEHNSIATTIPAGDPPNPDDKRKLADLRTRLAIRLNPEEHDTIALLHAIDQIDERRLDPDEEFEKAQAEMLLIARRLLKREWVRIKDELA